MNPRQIKYTKWVLIIIVIILANLIGLVLATALVPPIDSQGAVELTPTSAPTERPLPTHAPTEAPPGFVPRAWLPYITK